MIETTTSQIKDEVLPENIIADLSVDNLVLTVHEGKLKILLAKYTHGLAEGQWGLIGHWVQMDECLEDAAMRVVKETTGVENLYLDQLGAFSKVNRYPVRRVITVAYYSLVRFEEAHVINGKHTDEIRWCDVADIPELIFDHKEILDACLKHLKYKVRHEPIGFNLLPEKFTLSQLQEIYEALLDTKLDKPNFRRKFNKMNLLIDCKEKQKNVSHRAASLYRFDINVYEKLTEFGFTFEF